jgi:putative Mg2+ transporter-C (MgtC) family protein
VTPVDFLVRLAVAALLGVAIGLERQWRHRPAGLHTSSLISIGAALFALLDTTVNAGDKMFIVGGVVTGVGFIAGGAILRSGLNVTGLNTAATMWATAAVGALAGFGLWPQAAAGAVAVVGFNLVLQPLADAIDRRSGQVGEVVYKLSIVCDPGSQPAISAAILSAIGGSPLALQSLTREQGEGKNVELHANIFSPRPEPKKIDNLSSQLLSAAGVERVDWNSADAA